MTAPAPTPDLLNGTPTPSSTPPGTSPGAPSAESWRAPASAGRFAGKTAEEVLGIAAALTDIVERGAQPPAPPAPLPADDIADDEYVSGAQVKRLLQSRPVDDTPVRLAADANLSITRQRFARDFERYGSEIDAKLRTIPHNLRTLDNLETVVKLVRSDHLDEIVSEEATRRASEMAPALRSSGAAAPGAPVTREYSLESDKIDPEWKRRALESGITERVVEDFCRANDMPVEAFYKQFEKPLSAIVSDRGSKRAR